MQGQLDGPNDARHGSRHAWHEKYDECEHGRRRDGLPPVHQYVNGWWRRWLIFVPDIRQNAHPCPVCFSRGLLLFGQSSSRSTTRIALCQLDQGRPRWAPTSRNLLLLLPWRKQLRKPGRSYVCRTVSVADGISDRRRGGQIKSTRMLRGPLVQVTETQQSYRNSSTGVEKLAVERTLNDQGRKVLALAHPNWHSFHCVRRVGGQGAQQHDRRRALAEPVAQLARGYTRMHAQTQHARDG